MGMHRQKADEAYVIGKRGQYTPVAAYLAGDEIIKIALAHGEFLFAFLVVYALRCEVLT
jgi:pyruvate carboxylase